MNSIRSPDISGTPRQPHGPTGTAEAAQPGNRPARPPYIMTG